ncbi:MAG: hypothetical protein EOP10_01240 [Proteobacteria bacterium]|nr:MAG: hypothetical protein EOP10_01240 [Pseudomonadota bacterium]
MRKLLLVIGLLFCSSVFADTYKVCVPDLGGCLIAGGPSIYLPPNMFLMADDTTKKEFLDAGYAIVELTPTLEKNLSPTLKNNMTFSTADANAAVDALGDEFYESLAGCAGGVLGCSAATLAVPEMPLLFWIAKAGCIAVGDQCYFTVKKYFKWQTTSKELREAEKKAAAEKQTSSGGSHGDAHRPTHSSGAGFGSGGGHGGGGTLFSRPLPEYKTKIDEW